MVNYPRGSSDPRRIRRLKSPHEIEVKADSAGIPLRVRLGGKWQQVALVRRPWRIDQHWWSEAEVSRLYFRIAPADGPTLTIYHDLINENWLRQEYL